MNIHFKELTSHMKEFGLYIMSTAIFDAMHSEMGTPFAHAQSVIVMAQGAEITLKAIIGEQEPHLLFKDVDYSKLKTLNRSKTKNLLMLGKTYTLKEHPSLLYKSTGYKIQKEAEFKEFCNLRNIVMHLAAPNWDLEGETISFASGIMQPIVTHFYNEKILAHHYLYDEELEEMSKDFY